MAARKKKRGPNIGSIVNKKRSADPDAVSLSSRTPLGKSAGEKKRFVQGMGTILRENLQEFKKRSSARKKKKK